jgi:hypothetical protein
MEYGSVTPAYYPNTNSYYNGQVKQTGIRIYDISPSATTMTFRVSGVSLSSVASSPSTDALGPTQMTTAAQPTTAPILATTVVPTTIGAATPTTPPAPILTPAPTETSPSDLNDSNIMTLSDSSAPRWKVRTLRQLLHYLLYFKKCIVRQTSLCVFSCVYGPLYIL